MKQRVNAAARNPKVVIIGGGMSGMLMGIRLKQAGIDSFEILEKAETIGGTWRENTYPGLSCDVPAYFYSYSFEPNPEWTHRYARGPEIQRYFLRTYEKYGLAAHLRPNRTVQSVVHENKGWTVTTDDGVCRRADIVVSAVGVLHHPNTPDIPGLDSFAGKTMHSARWDHGVAVDGRRIGIIGTGSTAVQLVCGLVDRAKSVSMFQRTAQWIMPGRDARYSKLGISLLRQMPELIRLFYWGYESVIEHTLAKLATNKRVLWLVDKLCRRHLATVRDPVLRRKLTPDYKPGCKRMIMSDGFYEAIQQPNAQLVDDGIERIEPRGVRTKDGRLHELDVLVLATGFKPFTMGSLRVQGPEGRTLAETWSDGAKAYRTVGVTGFPNFFMMLGPHSPIGNFSLTSIAEKQSDYIMQLVELFRQGVCDTIEPQRDATEQYNEALRHAAKDTVWASGCKSWYLDKNGFPALWPWSYTRFREELTQPRLADFKLGSTADIPIKSGHSRQTSLTGEAA